MAEEQIDTFYADKHTDYVKRFAEEKDTLTSVCILLILLEFDKNNDKQMSNTLFYEIHASNLFFLGCDRTFENERYLLGILYVDDAQCGG